MHLGFRVPLLVSVDSLFVVFVVFVGFELLLMLALMSELVFAGSSWTT
jgi:hypothetical protein